METTQNQAISFLIFAISSAVLAAVTTPLFARAARAIGLVVKPRGDRWHAKAMPLLGGGALIVAVVIPLALVMPLDMRSIGLIAACAAAFALGLIDDFRRIAPTSKLVGQVIVAGIVVGS